MGCATQELHAPSLATALPVGLLLVLARVVEVVLVERDTALSQSTLQAIAVARQLQTPRFVRHRHVFPKDPQLVAEARDRHGPALGPAERPLFTLKRPLVAGERRRLNLFEPRWLALMDDAAARNGGSLIGAELLLVIPSNRLYTPGPKPFAIPRPEADSAGDGDGEGPAAAAAAGRKWRTADLVIGDEGWIGRVVRAEEGRREVTRARRLRVWVEADRRVRFDPRSVQPRPAGYLVAQVGSDAEGPGDCGASDAEAQQRPVRCVCVVGLLHVNGVVREIECDVR